MNNILRGMFGTRPSPKTIMDCANEALEHLYWAWDNVEGLVPTNVKPYLSKLTRKESVLAKKAMLNEIAEIPAQWNFYTGVVIDEPGEHTQLFTYFVSIDDLILKEVPLALYTTFGDHINRLLGMSMQQAMCSGIVSYTGALIYPIEEFSVLGSEENLVNNLSEGLALVKPGNINLPLPVYNDFVKTVLE